MRTAVALVQPILALSEGAATAVLLPAVMIPAALQLWALRRHSVLTRRLHPLTPAQRRAKRKAYGVMTSLVVVTFAILAALGTGGLVVLLAVYAALLIIDAVLTPWLHYRRAKRNAKAS